MCRCLKTSDGQKQLRDGTLWLPALWEALVGRALATAAPKALRFAVQNPNRRRLWLVPLLVAAQYALKVYVFDRVVDEDSWKGDKNGEYDAETQRCATPPRQAALPEQIAGPAVCPRFCRLTMGFCAQSAVID